MRINVIPEEIIKSWWVFIFFLACVFFYDNSINKKTNEIILLTNKIEKLKFDISEAIDLQKDLQHYIKHQNDPQLIELSLMKKLGLVPNGYTKVILPKSSTEK